MNDKLIDTLAGKLGTTAENVFSALVKQAPISASVNIVSMSIFLLIVALSWALVKKCDPDSKGPVLVLAALISIIWIAMAIALAPEIASGFVNPEYCAIREIAWYFKSAK